MSFILQEKIYCYSSENIRGKKSKWQTANLVMGYIVNHIIVGCICCVQSAHKTQNRYAQLCTGKWITFNFLFSILYVYIKQTINVFNIKLQFNSNCKRALHKKIRFLNKALPHVTTDRLCLHIHLIYIM